MSHSLANDSRACLDEVKTELCYQERMTLLKEYELSQEMHNYYGHLTWQIGSILIGAGITGLALVPREILPFLGMSTVTIFGFMVAFMALVFLLFMERYRRITFAHLARCREIEACLGMKQHRYVQKAGYREDFFRRQDGVPEEIQKIHWPSGWRLVQALCVGLIVFALFLAICYWPNAIRLMKLFFQWSIPCDLSCLP